MIRLMLIAAAIGGGLGACSSGQVVTPGGRGANLPPAFGTDGGVNKGPALRTGNLGDEQRNNVNRGP